ncbi:DUF1330 domain-containing protein [Pigmentiphaga sp. YJ18]|uniref:DUF1330 domain-containing protein n=1 Tax=Pigmentiphaga sp. YJ18 TaxID=3134907 RepID=UPI00311345AF
MAKGYVIARVEVTDPQAYAAYARVSAEAARLHGGKVLAKAGAYVELEGEAKPRNVVLEFPSLAQAVAYYSSVEYQAARAKRAGAAIVDIVAVEGVDEELGA